MKLLTSCLPGSEKIVASREFGELQRLCADVVVRLSEDRQTLTERVARRAVGVGIVLGLGWRVLVRLEAAARLHRLGEIFLDQSLTTKSYEQMEPAEMGAYLSYPLLSAVRVSENVHESIYQILLRHREYVSEGEAPADGQSIASLGARILCLVTEYEELLHFAGDDEARVMEVENTIRENAEGLYDDAVVYALFRSITAEHPQH